MKTQNKRASRQAVGLIVATLLIVIHEPVMAQDRQFSDEQIEQLIEQVRATQERLQLTDEQKEQVAPVLENSREKRMAVLEKHGFGSGNKPELSFRQKRSLAKQMRSIRKETEKELAKILSKEQMVEYKKIQDENRDKFRERMKSR